jgi:hypothetical protein
MKLYYTYGQPQLLLKNISTRYYNEYKSEHDIDLNTFIKNQKLKMKGWFIPNLWLGNGPIEISNNTWCSYDRLVKMYIAAAFIDWYVVNNACSLHLEKPLAKFIKHDIDLLVFNRESFITGDYAQYKAFWDEHYEYIIGKMYLEVVNNWNDKVPSAYIQNLFTNSYTYKKRNRKSKWSWLSQYTPEEIAQRLIEEGKTKVEGAIVSAMKHLHLSVKAVQDALNKLLDKLSAEEIKTFQRRSEIKLWASEKTFNQLCDLSLYFEMEDVMFVTVLIRAYGFSDQWLYKGCVNFIKQTIKDQKLYIIQESKE